jgi:site-specific DNA-methyltransferase (adenine-specific)
MIELLNIDCMEYMAKLPDKAFDLAVVDPPYGIGVSNAKEIGYKGNNVFTPKTWDNKTPPQEYFDELRRVSVHQIVWGGNYYQICPSRCYLIWDKGEGFKGRTYAEAELAWTSFNANVRIFKRDPLANGDYRGKIHPTQKPVALYEWILRNYAKPGQRILDTHLGSGSSAIAAHYFGCDFVGCEIDVDYFNAARERFDRETRQVSMF